MNLHNEKDLFEQAITMTSEKFNIAESIIEKDYFVTLYLKRLSENLPELVFKGGTSLSKCYKLINRFSEDIDLSLNVDKATEGMRKNYKNVILQTNNELGLDLNNTEDIKSNRYYNRYEIVYPTIFTPTTLKPFLYIETVLNINSYPTEIKSADSFLYQYLKSENQDNLISKYGLYPFEINVQQLNRTFIDKVFALGDYYLDGKIKGHSRHLYDLYKIYPEITFNDDFRALVKEVREIRRQNKICRSAQDGIDLQELLIKIVKEDYYKHDYNSITSTLLFDKVTYEESLKTLRAIIDNEYFK